MAEVVAIISKVIITVVFLMAFIIGLLVAIDPTDFGIMILEVLKISFPNPMIDQFIMELRILGAVFTILGFAGFLFSLLYLWKE